MAKVQGIESNILKRKKKGKEKKQVNASDIENSNKYWLGPCNSLWRVDCNSWNNLFSFCDLGSLFAVVASLEVVETLLGSLIFNSIYSATVSQQPGFCYFLISGMLLLPICSMMWVFAKSVFHSCSYCYVMCWGRYHCILIIRGLTWRWWPIIINNNYYNNLEIFEYFVLIWSLF